MHHAAQWLKQHVPLFKKKTFLTKLSLHHKTVFYSFTLIFVSFVLHNSVVNTKYMSNLLMFFCLISSLQSHCLCPKFWNGVHSPDSVMTKSRYRAARAARNDLMGGATVFVLFEFSLQIIIRRQDQNNYFDTKTRNLSRTCPCRISEEFDLCDWI